MLRLLVVLLVLANLGFYAWTEGWLGAHGGGREHEPERLAQQVQPERMRLLAAASAASANAPTEPVRVCLEIGPFSSDQIVDAEVALQKVVPLGRYTNIKTETPAVWIVFMGRYADRETLQKKMDELKKLKIPFEELHEVPELGDGLALGRFPDAATAEQGLASVSARGVRTARVAQLSTANASHLLRVELVDAPLQAKLLGLQSSSLQGKTFSACPR